MADQVKVETEELRALVQAAFEIGNDRQIENLTDAEREKHIADLIDAAIPLAMALGIADSEQGVREHFGQYL